MGKGEGIGRGISELASSEQNKQVFFSSSLNCPRESTSNMSYMYTKIARKVQTI